MAEYKLKFRGRIMKKIFLMLALIPFSAISFAGGQVGSSSHTSHGSNGSYFKLTFSDSELKADSFSFHNPGGIASTDNDTSGNYIVMTSVNDELSSNAVSLAYGTHIMGMRTELSYTMREEVGFTGQASFSSIQYTQEMRVDADELMVTMYHDTPTSIGTFSLGIGAGLTFSESNGYQGRNIEGGSGYFPRNKDEEFAYALSAGLSMEIMSNVEIDVRYSYKDLGDISTGYTQGIAGMNDNERLETDLEEDTVSVSLSILF